MPSASKLTTAAFALLTATQAGAAEPHGQHSATGQVDFDVACNEAAQQKFNTAVGHFHSFNWAHVAPAAAEVLEADPSCGMAHWINAFAMLSNPFAWPGGISAAAMERAPAALQAAREAGLQTEREQDYVAALETFFEDHGTVDHRTRARRLEEAFKQIAERYPDDPEASIFYALVLSANFDPTDDQYVNQLKAAEILEPLFERYPQHPGVAHYLIHSYDYPTIADNGIEAATTYASLAPAISHANHMPSHIFTRVGMWDESIATNRVAADAADDAVAADGHHALDYMVYAHLQKGNADAAKTLLQEQKGRNAVDSFTVAFSHAAIPARIALESDDWEGAANLALYPAAADYPWQKYPHGEAVNAYARGIGAALTGDFETAQREMERLESFSEAARAAWGDYWADQVAIQAEVVRGLLVYGQGEVDEGISVLRQAADREDATAKHVVMPARVIPARELLATVLEREGRHPEALVAYEAVLEREPRRLRASKGAARAAGTAGDGDKEAHYEALVAELTEK